MVNKKNYNKVIKFLNEKPGYIKTNSLIISKCLDLKDLDSINAAKKDIRFLKQSKSQYKANRKIKDRLKKLRKENKKIQESSFKRLFFDIEVSPNLVFSWQIGNKIALFPENIVEERQIICISYKWEGNNKVHSIKWIDNNDENIVREFYPIIASADELVGHNLRGFDVKWFKTRALYYGLPSFGEIPILDTLTISRSKFKFNSNKLDYIIRYLKLGAKKDNGGFDTWKKIILHKDKKSLDLMVKYCEQDVLETEKVFNSIKNYGNFKTNRAILIEGDYHHCPECTSPNTGLAGTKTTLAGVIRRKMLCKDCGLNFTISNKKYQDSFKLDLKKD